MARGRHGGSMWAAHERQVSGVCVAQERPRIGTISSWERVQETLSTLCCSIDQVWSAFSGLVFPLAVTPLLFPSFVMPFGCARARAGVALARRSMLARTL